MSTRDSLFGLALLALCAIPARAQSTTTYYFLEAGSSQIGASLVFNSPPATPESQWSATETMNVRSFTLYDGRVAPVGSYSPYAVNVSSSNGTSINLGVIAASGAGSSQLLTGFNQTTMNFVLQGSNGGVAYGQWVLPFRPVAPSPVAAASVSYRRHCRPRCLRLFAFCR
jgi:hypothetical protein